MTDTETWTVTDRIETTRRTVLKGAITAGVSLSGLAAVTGQAGAAPLRGQPRWEHSPSVNIEPVGGPDGELVVTLAKDAVHDFWNDEVNPDGEADSEIDQNVPASWTDFDAGGFGPVSVGGSGTDDITITWRDLGVGMLGRALITTSRRRTITNATIEIDPYSRMFRATDEDYKNIIAHELGHAIGLGHSDQPGTLMHRFARRTPAYQPLSRSSIQTLNQLYG